MITSCFDCAENMIKNKRTAAAATVFDHPPPLEVDMDLRFKER